MIDNEKIKKVMNQIHLCGYYSGIGSRETPDNILELFTYIASKLTKANYILRTGGSSGADNSFEIGCNLINNTINNNKKEIYLPWKYFNNNKSEIYIPENYKFDDYKAQIAEKFHPAFNNLNEFGKRLMCRNSQIILGKYCDLKYKSDFVIAYCKRDSKGKLIGGTSQGLRIAEYYKIPIFNITDEKYCNNHELFINDIFKYVMIYNEKLKIIGAQM